MYKIYWLKPENKPERWILYANEMSFKTEICEYNLDHASSQRRSEPLKLIVHLAQLTDFQWTPYGEAIVSRKIIKLFKKNDISGVYFNKIKTYTNEGIEVDQELYELRVEGWGGMAVPDSGVRLIERCQHCGHSIFTAYDNAVGLFNFEDWDGSDVFMIWPLPRRIIATGRVRDLILSNDLSGVEVLPLAETPQPLGKTLTPGSVLDWIRGERGVAINETINARLKRQK